MADRKLELRRQVFHILSGTVLAVLFYLDIINKYFFIGLFTVFSALFMINTYYRIPLLSGFLELMERPHVKFKGTGAIFFLLGMMAAVLLFSREIATAAILIVSWSDGIATLVGPYGMIAYTKKKKWEGIIAAIAVGAAAGAFVVPWVHAIFASAVSMLIEGLDIKVRKWKIDDNLFIPLISGLIMFFFKL